MSSTDYTADQFFADGDNISKQFVAGFVDLIVDEVEKFAICVLINLLQRKDDPITRDRKES